MTSRLMIEISVREVRADAEGFGALAKLHADLSQFHDEMIGIDFKWVTWVDAQLGACLMTVVHHSRRLGNDILLFNIEPRIQTILQKNNTLSGTVLDNYGTTMPVTSFPLDGEIQFADYTRKNLSRRQMPRMSDGLKGKFFEGIDELFANSSLHSKSQLSVFACGQYFPRMDKLSFIISDGGRGIRGSLEAAGREFETASEAIDWAMELNNSARSGDIPGGLGLGILKEFIALNGGCLTVCSQAGFWAMRGDDVEMTDLGYSYPGTVVSLDINTADAKSYYMASNVDPNDIW